MKEKLILVRKREGNVSLCDFSPVIIYSLTTSGKPIDQFSEASNFEPPHRAKATEQMFEILVGGIKFDGSF